MREARSEIVKSALALGGENADEKRYLAVESSNEGEPSWVTRYVESSSHCFGAILVHPGGRRYPVALGRLYPGNGVFLNGYRIQRQADKRVRRDAFYW